MSIIIRGIKMPSGLAERGLIIRGDGTVYNFIGTTIEGAYAVEVPVSHGRLIDADALTKCIEDLPNCYNGFSDTYDKACIIGVIDEQITIIEAEEV